MLGRIINFSLNFRYLVLIGAAAVLYFGGISLRSQPVDILPEFAPLVVQVQTEAAGLAPAEVESLITAPLEEILSGIPWLDTMQSKSIAGLSSVTLSFEEGTTLLKARQMVQERLLHTTVLPKVSKPPAMLQPVSDLNRAMQIGLTSSKLALTDVSLLARWKIKPRLMSVPGVSNVIIWGQRERQLQVAIDTEKLKARGVQLQDVIKASGDALWVSPLTYLRSSTPGTGGFIDTPTQRYDIRHVLPISSPSDLARVTFAAKDGTLLTLGDVASVVEGHQPLIGDGIVDGAPGLMLVVEKLPGANTLEVTRGVERALDALAPGLSDVTIRPAIYRPATYLQAALDNLLQLLTMGAALIALALFAMFRDWRATVICLAAIALSLLAGWFALFLLGVTANAMLLSGLAIAVVAVVDDAISDVHAIRRKLLDGASTEPLASKIFTAAMGVRPTLLYVTIIIALMAFPIAFMSGAGLALLKPMLIATLVALAASALVAHTITPALCLLMYPASADTSSAAAPNGLQTRYESLLSSILAAPSTTLTLAGLVGAVGLIAFAMAPKMVVPPVMDRDLVVQWETKFGTSHQAMSAMVGEAAAKVRALPGIREVGGHLGRAVQSDRTTGVNFAELWVGMTPEANYAQTVQAIKSALAGYPGTRTDPQPYESLKINAALAKSADTAVVRLFGPKWDVLEAKAGDVQKALSGVPGLINPRIQTRIDSTNIKIEVNLEKARAAGIKPGDVRRGVATQMAGIEVGSLYEEQKIFEVIVWGSNEARHNPDGIRNLVIDTPSGGNIRLGDVADVSEVLSPAVIYRKSASRYLDIVADLQDPAAGNLAARIAPALASLQLPLEYNTEIITADAGTDLSDRWVRGSALAAILGIFLLLQTLLGRWTSATIAVLAMAVAVAAGALMVIVGGASMSFGALIGLAAVPMIALRQCALLMTSPPQDQGEGFGSQQLLGKASDRLLPVLTTTLCLAALTLPVIARGTVAGLEILHPMALAVLGGAIASAVLTLFVVPAALAAYGRRQTAASVPQGQLAAQGGN